MRAQEGAPLPPCRKCGGPTVALAFELGDDPLYVCKDRRRCGWVFSPSEPLTLPVQWE